VPAEVTTARKGRPREVGSVARSRPARHPDLGVWSGRRLVGYGPPGYKLLPPLEPEVRRPHRCIARG
jgi:hypothetical protein